MDNRDGTFRDTSPHFQTQGSGGERPPAPPRPNSTCGEHVVAAAMQGARSRRPDASTRGGVAHLRFFQTTGLKRRKQCPPRADRKLPRAPALLHFWNLPHAGARRRMRSGERGRGAGPHIANPRRHEGGARLLLCPPPETASTPAPSPTALRSSLPRVPVSSPG